MNLKLNLSNTHFTVCFCLYLQKPRCLMGEIIENMYIFLNCAFSHLLKIFKSQFVKFFNAHIQILFTIS